MQRNITTVLTCLDIEKRVDGLNIKPFFQKFLFLSVFCECLFCSLVQISNECQMTQKLSLRAVSHSFILEIIICFFDFFLIFCLLKMY